MAGKKIDRKKQSLLSRSSKRQATIKKLTHKPVIKHVDVAAIKESFKKTTKHHKAKEEPKPEAAVEIASAAPSSHEKKGHKTAKGETEK
jgi:hypothetical protein